MKEYLTHDQLTILTKAWLKHARGYSIDALCSLILGKDFNEAKTAVYNFVCGINRAGALA